MEISQISPLGYVLFFVILAVLGILIFCIKKLKYSYKQVLKSVGLCLIIVVAIEIIILILGLSLNWFELQYQTAEKPDCINCYYDYPTEFEAFLYSTAVTGPSLLGITLLAYYLVKVFRKKKR